MKWRTDALTPGCLKSAQKLKTFPWLKDFYLAGGTALALRYSHRVSVDLDFFSRQNALDWGGREPLLESLESLGSAMEEQKDGTIHARHGTTHVSFSRYRYPLLAPLARWDGIAVAAPLDIGLMKIGAIIGRGSKKDFMDLYVLAQNGPTLSTLLRAAPKKFSAGADFTLQACRALVYFKDAEEEPSLKMLRPVSWPEVKRFFEAEVRRLSHAYKK